MTETSFNLAANIYISYENVSKVICIICLFKIILPLYLHDTFRSLKSYNLILLSLEVTRILSSPGMGSMPLILRPVELRPRVDLTWI